MDKDEFRKSVVSGIEEITRDEYIDRDNKLDFHIKFTDGNLYYKPKENKENYSK